MGQTKRKRRMLLTGPGEGRSNSIPLLALLPHQRTSNK